MSELDLYYIVLAGMLVSAALSFVSLFFVTAAYGRYVRPGWGPTLSATAGWILMEAPSPILFTLFWWLGTDEHRFSTPGLVFLVLWLLHYVHRAFIFPFRRRGGQPRMPLSIAGMAVLFNCFNAWINAHWLYSLGPVRGTEWLWDPRFLAGILLFVLGYFINQQSDHILFSLRKPGETGYKIPQGGLYRYISCPNYFGELLEWTGYALLTWSPGALVFGIWTAANLVPRARTHHRWYQEKFPDYPPERKAIFPFLY